MLEDLPISKAPLTLLLALGVCASPLAGCSPLENENSAGSKPNVVLVCMDTVRRDHLGTYGHERDTSPFLDELARRSTLFRDASSAASWTKPSVPSFLTGKYPCQHGVYEGSASLKRGSVTDTLPDEALLIAEVFKEDGYRTGAFVHNAQLRYGNGFEQGFDLYRCENMDAEEIRWRGLDWLDAKEDEPFFLYLHFLDAHWPYPVPHSYATLYAEEEVIAPFQKSSWKLIRRELNDGNLEITEAQREGMKALYDGAIRYIDDQLALFHQALVLRGLDENTILCVVSDHGEEFGEHGLFGHGHELWQGLLEVPWILFVPGRPAKVIDVPVSLVDLFPTLLSAAGLTSPEEPEGVDRLSRPNANRPIFAEHKSEGRYIQSLREGHRKTNRHFEGPVRDLEEPPTFAVGERWEVEFKRDENGQMIATQFKPDDGDYDDPVELKGMVTNTSNDLFELSGIPVEVRSGTKKQLAEGARSTEIVDSQVVKVRGEMSDDAFVAERIKFYARGDSSPTEIRGPIEVVELKDGKGRIKIADWWVLFGPETNVKEEKRNQRKRLLRRGEIVAILEAGDSVLEEMGIAKSLEVYDLETDPGEHNASTSAAGTTQALMDMLGKTLTRGRFFSDSDRLLLTPQAIQELRNIGYAE
ncbi:MAG: hypothetical protein CMJ89_07995 [Planctomycetes bacterium]|jgi:arylsulfatase|nr:hypothetical protein [Planctomycetota bacterium]